MFEYFYYETIHNTIVAFGSLFNNIYIKHKDDVGTTKSTLKVPIQYGSIQKFLARLRESPDLNNPFEITTPRVSIELIDLSYDSNSKGTQTQTFVVRDNNNQPRKSYLPIPYTLNLDLNIFTKLEEDMFQIVEQILPYFQPSYTVSLKAINEINERKDVAFTLNNISMTNNYEGNFDDRRVLIWSLKFSAKIFLYLPISSTSSTANELITKVNIGFIAGDSNPNSPFVDVNYTITPTAAKNYTGTVVTTLSQESAPDSNKIYVTDATNINVNTFISINDETLYVDEKNGNQLIVNRGVYGTMPKLQISGSNVLNITTIDNNLIVYGDNFGISNVIT